MAQQIFVNNIRPIWPCHGTYPPKPSNTLGLHQTSCFKELMRGALRSIAEKNSWLSAYKKPKLRKKSEEQKTWIL